MQILPLFYLLFLSSWKADFLSRKSWKTFYAPIWSKKTQGKKTQIFDQNHGLTPLRKLQILPLFEFVVFIA